MKLPVARFVFNAILWQRVVSQLTLYTTYGVAPASPAETALCVSAGACDGRVLRDIGPPAGGGQTQTVAVQLFNGMEGAATPPVLGRPVKADFQGFSIELSVSNHILGNDGTLVNPIFLNLMSTLSSRSGKVLIRVGGNSQERATVVLEGLPKNQAINKTEITGFTPTLNVSPNLIYAMGNISNFVPSVYWFIGLPFNDINNPRHILAEITQKVLGDHLVGMQMANEPDLYPRNGLRTPEYTPADFNREFGEVLQGYKNNKNVPITDNFVAPSVCCGGIGGGWFPEQVFDTGFLTNYASSLKYISVEHYPTNNCNTSGAILDPDVLLGQFFLNHSAVQELTAPYINSANIAQSMGKEFIMFETNTASCGGFSGLSDSFAAALWAIDYNLNMATNNFTNALYHVGGQRAYYNPFTPPPTNQTKFRQWTIGPVMYSALVTAEILGTTGKARVTDLGLNFNNPYSPGYAIYEDGVPQRVVLINYLTDQSGGANYTANIAIGGGNTGTPGVTPSSVNVKYFIAPSASEKWNITWAGQTFGGPYASDGRLKGDERIISVPCDTTNNVCAVTVPAPGIAVVFLSETALRESAPQATNTFATTAFTERNTATIDPKVLATSNGRGGQNFIGIGSTSYGSANDANRLVAGAVVFGTIFASSLFILLRTL